MQRKFILAGALFVVLGFVSGIAAAQTQWFRNGRYYLPTRNMKGALEEILTDMQAQIDGVTAANGTQQIQIDANTTSISAHVNDTGNAHDHDSRYVRDEGENLRILRGLVLPNGQPNAQPFAGFTITKGGPGTYTITPTTPFADIPSVIIDSRGTRTTCGFSLGPSSATVTICNFAGVPTDSEFRFILVGGQ